MEPHDAGFALRAGVRLWYEVYGSGDTTLLLMPTWAIFPSRHWKMQIPYLARRYRVVTFDGRGNGRSDRPADDTGYGDLDQVADAVAVLDATGTRTCVAAGLSWGAKWAVLLAAAHPHRVEAVVAIGPSVPLGVRDPDRAEAIRWDEHIDDPHGWQKHNRHYWLRHYADWAEFFVGRIYTEPHSTKPREDGLRWALQTDGATLVRTYLSPSVGEDAFRQQAQALSQPLLVLHGTGDAVAPHLVGERLAAEAGGELHLLEGAGHAPMVRDPVRVNLVIGEFVERVRPTHRPLTRWTRGPVRPKRVLYISSPIGLGHVRRDIAIAEELRTLHHGLEIDWLAQSPVTNVLEARGERIHPASGALASEVAHIEAESGEHRLHCFQAIRRMDEILLANFMTFHDVVHERHYDLVVGDEAWEVDYYLHENPELKNSAYVWLSDFVGWLPMPSGGEHEARLTADYNAEMIGHIARFPRVRDRAIFVGDPDDIVPHTFGPGLPGIREWTDEHFDFAGYVTGFDPADLGRRRDLRRDLGYGDDERVCIVAVGGSGVGLPLLVKMAEAFPAVRRAVGGLRMIMIAGPRIDPGAVPAHEGLEVHRYVDRLYRHLYASDLAVVQGGLTTCMELTATKRPFIYVPLVDHFEQNLHVRARLERYGAGRLLAYDDMTPDRLVTAIVDELTREPAYRDVATDGAARAARMIAELL
jgi:pimeloyl-ACP methyl ester carboxylesterase/predicted glycosyltransferase